MGGRFFVHVALPLSAVIGLDLLAIMRLWVIMKVGGRARLSGWIADMGRHGSCAPASSPHVSSSSGGGP